jgi:hypothetical protein
MSPLKATGVKLNQAALNCRRVLALNGALGGRLIKSPQLLKNPALMAELRLVTALMHCSLVVSKSMAMEMAAVLIPEAMLMVTGTEIVSPIQPVTAAMLVAMFGPAGALTVMMPVAVLVPPVQPPVMVTV